MTLKGAQVIFVPASFYDADRERSLGTAASGQSHRERLLHCGAGADWKETGLCGLGNSLVADPWGTVIARAKDVPGITYAEIDLDYLDQIRKQIPSWKTGEQICMMWRTKNHSQ